MNDKLTLVASIINLTEEVDKAYWKTEWRITIIMAGVFIWALVTNFSGFTDRKNSPPCRA